jgi:hypothetical protein
MAGPVGRILARVDDDRLIGRDPELAKVAETVAHAAVRGASLLLTGEPGMGKSVLLDAAARVASVAGIRVVRVAGVEFRAGVSFFGLDQLLTPLAVEAAGLSTGHRDALRTALGLRSGPVANRLSSPPRSSPSCMRPLGRGRCWCSSTTRTGSTAPVPRCWLSSPGDWPAPAWDSSSPPDLGRQGPSSMRA